MEQTDTLFSSRSVADMLGAASSAACALHCVAVPLLLIAGVSAPASFLPGEWFHRAMLLVIVPAALLAFGSGCRVHQDRWVLLLGICGVVGLLFAGFAPHEVLSENGERVVTLGFAAVLIAAHLRNFKLCRGA